MQNQGKRFGASPPTKQEITANQCPMNCGKENAVMVARPPQGSVATWWSRCQRCLAYWETSPAGKVTALRVVETFECCPDCYEHKTLTHVCPSR